MRLDWRPLGISIEGDLIFIQRGEIYIAIKPSEIKELVGKLSAIDAAIGGPNGM